MKGSIQTGNLVWFDGDKGMVIDVQGNQSLVELYTDRHKYSLKWISNDLLSVVTGGNYHDVFDGMMFRCVKKTSKYYGKLCVVKNRSQMIILNTSDLQPMRTGINSRVATLNIDKLSDFKPVSTFLTMSDLWSRVVGAYDSCEAVATRGVYTGTRFSILCRTSNTGVVRVKCHSNGLIVDISTNVLRKLPTMDGEYSQECPGFSQEVLNRKSVTKPSVVEKCTDDKRKVYTPWDFIPGCFYKDVASDQILYASCDSEGKLLVTRIESSSRTSEASSMSGGYHLLEDVKISY